MLDLSVVIPSYNNRGHLADVIRALELQQPPVRELIVSHSGTGESLLSELNPAIPCRWLHSDQRLNSGEARNRGAEAARGEWLAFIDDDVILAPNWTAQLFAIMQQDDNNTCYVGSVDCDRSGGYWGLSLWFTEFGSVHSYMPSRIVEGGASANMAMHREIYQRAGGFPVDIARCVDVNFMCRCRKAGARTYFSSSLVAGHRNIPGLRHCLAHALSLGRGSAAVRKNASLKGDYFVKYPFMIPLLFVARLALMTYRIVRWGGGQRASFAIRFPGIVLTVLYWTLGFYRSAVRP